MSESSQSFSKRTQPEQQAPPVQRLRLRYAKRGRARFTSHRDFGRAFERALRRAGVPMAYSSGFSPHPRISYANASPTSAATEAEYLEIGLSRACDPERVRSALDQVMPEGLRMLEVIEADGASLADRLTASAWLMELGEVDVEALVRGVAAVMAAEQLQVQRMTKNGLRDFDVRAAVVHLDIAADQRLRLLARHVTPLVRPDDVVRALRQLEPGLAGDRPALFTRVLQGQLDESGGLVDPFTGAIVRPW